MTSLPQVMAPVLTPFKDDLSCDIDLFVRFCRWLVAEGVGLAVFGTNSEANSLHGRMRNRRQRVPNIGRGSIGLCRRADAAAVLLQAGQR